jgi:hypothetical protein
VQIAGPSVTHLSRPRFLVSLSASRRPATVLFDRTQSLTRFIPVIYHDHVVSCRPTHPVALSDDPNPRRCDNCLLLFPLVCGMLYLIHLRSSLDLIPFPLQRWGALVLSGFITVRHWMFSRRTLSCPVWHSTSCVPAFLCRYIASEEESCSSNTANSSISDTMNGQCFSPERTERQISDNSFSPMVAISLVLFPYWLRSLH